MGAGGRFLHERNSQTTSVTIALKIRQETIGIKALGILPHCGITVDHRQHHADIVVGRERIASADRRSLLRTSHEHLRGRVQTKRLVQDSSREFERLDLLQRRLRVVQDLVRLAPELRREIGVARDEVECEREQVRRRLVPRK